MMLRTRKLNTSPHAIATSLVFLAGVSLAYGCGSDDTADAAPAGTTGGNSGDSAEQVASSTGGAPGSEASSEGTGQSGGGANDDSGFGATAGSAATGTPSGGSDQGNSGGTAPGVAGSQQSSTGGEEAIATSTGGSESSATGGASEGGSGPEVPSGTGTGGTTQGPTGGTAQGPTGGGTEQGLTGGVEEEGTGGVPAGGSGAAGAAGDDGGGVPDPTPTSGCGAETWPENGRYSLEINGKTREYILTVPDGYDGTTPMKLISVWHGLNGTIDDMDNAFWGYYGMASVSDGTAIFTAGQGLPSEEGGTDYAWRNTDQEDTDFARAMFEWFSDNFCIDSERIFVTGMSYGGVMSNEVGCYVGDIVRAIGPIAGAGPGFGVWGGGGPECVGQVASILVHGTADETVTIDNGEASRDHWLEANACSATTQPTDPTEYCVEYDRCQADYPVVWCVHDGGHTIPDWSPQAIWDFFERF